MRSENHVCMLAVLFSFEVRSLDVSQAFLQSDNLSESDRRIAIPPNMVKLPRGGFSHSPKTNLRKLPPHSRVPNFETSFWN